MSDEIFRPESNDNTPPKMAPKGPTGEAPDNFGNPGPIKFTGQMPAAMKRALDAQQKKSNPEQQIRQTGSSKVEALIAGLRPKTAHFEEVSLPSRGLFYDDQNGPSNGILHMRPMTGDEEAILAEPRFTKSGQAVNKIFRNCLEERFNVEQLLSVDRNYLLIYLRMISYGSDYQVEIDCPGCDRKFVHTIELNNLTVNYCPENFNTDLSGVLPVSGYKFNYRLATGKDEQVISEEQQRQSKFGEQAVDNLHHFRTAILIKDIEELKDKKELIMLLKNLPILDVQHIRSVVNDPPFGVITKSDAFCYAGCRREFEVDLPFDHSFFFPRPKTKTMQS